MRHRGQERHVPPDTSGGSGRLAAIGRLAPARTAHTECRNLLLGTLIRVELLGPVSEPGPNVQGSQVTAAGPRVRGASPAVGISLLRSPRGEGALGREDRPCS